MMSLKPLHFSYLKASQERGNSETKLIKYLLKLVIFNSALKTTNIHTCIPGNAEEDFILVGMTTAIMNRNSRR